MTTIADTGSTIDGAYVWSVVAVVALALILAGLSAWLSRPAPEASAWLAWQRIQAAARVLHGRPAWTCGLCHRPVPLEGDVCQPCRRAMAEAFRITRPYDQEAQ